MTSTPYSIEQLAIRNEWQACLVAFSNGYEFSSGTKVIRGTSGFVGAANFVADANASSLKTGSSTFFLVESSLAPKLSDDIDNNDDGVPDGAYMNWRILDGVSILPLSENASLQRSYAPIVFTERRAGGFLDLSTVVETEAIGSVARTASSTGYAASDWVFGYAPDLLTAALDIPENSPAGRRLALGFC